jgi:tellurite resistance protein TehA-like permease
LNAVNLWHVAVGALSVSALVCGAVLVLTGHASVLAILALTAAIEAAIYWHWRTNRPAAPKPRARAFVPFREPTTVAGH